MQNSCFLFPKIKDFSLLEHRIISIFYFFFNLFSVNHKRCAEAFYSVPQTRGRAAGIGYGEKHDISFSKKNIPGPLAYKINYDVTHPVKTAWRFGDGREVLLSVTAFHAIKIENYLHEL